MGGVVVYFFISGFLVGWFFVCFCFGVVMSNVDVLLVLFWWVVCAGDIEIVCVV